jgi:hypothetical protein
MKKRSGFGLVLRDELDNKQVGLTVTGECCWGWDLAGLPALGWAGLNMGMAAWATFWVTKAF